MLPFILESAARALALGIVVGITLRLLRIRSAQIRSLAWTAVLLAGLTMPVLTLVMENLMAAAPQSAVTWIPSVSSTPLLPLPTVPQQIPASSFDWSLFATALYALVAAALAVRLMAGLVRGWHLRSTALPIRDTSTEGLDVRVSRRLQIPVTFGSSILVPAEWPEWSSFARGAVLSHEQEHIRRRDFYTHLLAGAHAAIFWFSPLAWWLRAQLLKTAEEACDDAAVRKTTDRVGYAELLVHFAQRGSQLGSVTMSMAGGRTVGRRIERLLAGEGIPPGVSLLARVLLFSAVLPLVVLSAGMWGTRRATEALRPIAAAVAQQTVSQAVPVTPTTPVQAATPAPRPVQPAAPATAVQPATPAPRPVQRAAPTIPVQPAVPATAVQPAKPAPRPVQRAAPATAVQPATPAPRPVQRAAPATPAQPATPESGQLQNWPNQVPDIISPAERAAFEALREDEERENFINSFWLRRDPTPGTTVNEYQAEYYRRVGLANQRYSRPGFPGWQSDRGRVLIRFGEPYEIETHAYGAPYFGQGPAPDTFPFEKWRYPFIEGIGNNVILEFVDVAKDGNYQLRKDGYFEIWK